MLIEHRTAFVKILLDLRETFVPAGVARQKRTAYYIAVKHGLHRSEFSKMCRPGYYVGPGTERRIIAAVAKEAAEAGLPFPAALFEEYLSDNISPSLTPPLKIRGGGEAGGVMNDTVTEAVPR